MSVVPIVEEHRVLYLCRGSTDATLIIVYKKPALRKTSLNLRKNKKQGLVLFVKFRNKIDMIR